MTAREWLQRAKVERFAIGAFNVGNLETFRAIAEAAAEKRSPVIVESSPGETKWLDPYNIVDIARNYSAEFGVPILVNLDHSETLEDCQKGIDAGYDMIHFDGSKLPVEQNVQILKQVVEIAHAKGLTVEGELDHIGGSSEVHEGAATTETDKAAKTNPEKAGQFVQATDIDIFAAFVGNIHGLYEGGAKELEIPLISMIAKSTGVFLSLHGSSGISDQQIKEAIQAGISKINLNTEMREIYRKTLETILRQNPKAYAMYKVEQPVIDAIKALVMKKIELFGSAGKV